MLQRMAQSNHREQLLQGAIQCLQSKGYARTTARDITTASGANLASIGYHFGSKEALLNEALVSVFTQWTEQIGEITLSAAEASPLQRLARAWEETLDGFRNHHMLVVAFVEAMAQVERSEELREQMAAHYQSIRAAVAVLIAKSVGGDQEQVAEEAQALASLLIALCDGFALQWLLDPQGIPDMQPLLDAVGYLLDGQSNRGEAPPGTPHAAPSG
jgi:AcrR family transcriptional regulator